MKTRYRGRAFWRPAGVAIFTCVSALGQTAFTSQQAGATIKTYCGSCHSAQAHTADIVLDPAALTHVADNAERWEKASRKLRTRTMPPPGMPRPDASTYDALATYVETALDRAAAAKPNPGKLPLLHRLSRTEYENAVRDLLAVDALPKEMDYSVLLPLDNINSGFDDIADLLFVSPTAMDSYLSAAEKISRLAVGDPTLPPMISVYRSADEKLQTGRVEELPLGTQGGMAIRSYFPVDGEYVFKVAARPNGQAQLEITVDWNRVQLADIGSAAGGGGRGGRGGRGSNAPVASVAAELGDGVAELNAPAPAPSAGGRGGRGAVPAVEYRIPIKAGQHLIGVTYIEKDEARDENVLRPRLRGAGPFSSIASVTISGSYNVARPGDSESRRRIFVCHPATAAEEGPCAEKIVSALARRAYRRPASPADIESLMTFYKTGRSAGNFDLGIQRGVQRVLVSPQFLFRIERDAAGVAPGTSHPVSDLELASRLSFFLWSSIPDDELLDLAIQGKLRQPGVLDRQVGRMLRNSRSSSLVTNFAEQWLYLRDLDARRPNEILFPDFDESLRDAMRKETDLFLDSVLRSDKSVLELLSANYSFVNERLAQHYGIPNVHGGDFRRLAFPPGSPRGGLLGQGSILTITSYANRTSPVNRGKWVLDNLLSSPPPTPPATVPALKTEANDKGDNLSMREAMVRHRADPACAGCHSRMDPIGFAMENFDPIGRWRDRDGGHPIDASGVFPDGSKFDGMAGMKSALVSHPEEFISTIVRRLMMYATGRNLQYYDEPAVRAIVREGAQSNYTFASLVEGVVHSTAFQMRQTPLTTAKQTSAQ
jgi:Protein of unknown function (DUF1592)/Protein of unknown function (DUF1588)/Protein of unknown function (DUF1585)/Protein of unknown function (DUF1595)/Protein of unknown function (DUF1587)